MKYLKKAISFGDNFDSQPDYPKPVFKPFRTQF